jgi:hypothetical protein
MEQHKQLNSSTHEIEHLMLVIEASKAAPDFKNRPLHTDIVLAGQSTISLSTLLRNFAESRKLGQDSQRFKASPV